MVLHSHLDVGAVAAGFGTGLSLIVAIGAQNSFVLRQGLRREHVSTIVTVCVASDLVLIVSGVAGLGLLVRTSPAALTVIAWAGAAFLIGYAFTAVRRALRPSAVAAAESGASGTSRRSSLLTAMGLTWLNPHVYLDTVLLVGSISAGYGGGRWMFAVGAGAASTLWFCGLGFGARLARPVFARPGSWRVLDGVIAATMLVIGIRLLMMQ
jgi:L-lysine exporter family protein LysE/ArgO